MQSFNNESRKYVYIFIKENPRAEGALSFLFLRYATKFLLHLQVFHLNDHARHQIEQEPLPCSRENIRALPLQEFWPKSEQNLLFCREYFRNGDTQRSIAIMGPAVSTDIYRSRLFALPTARFAAREREADRHVLTRIDASGKGGGQNEPTRRDPAKNFRPENFRKVDKVPPARNESNQSASIRLRNDTASSGTEKVDVSDAIPHRALSDNAMTS